MKSDAQCMPDPRTIGILTKHVQLCLSKPSDAQIGMNSCAQNHDAITVDAGCQLSCQPQANCVLAHETIRVC